MRKGWRFIPLLVTAALACGRPESPPGGGSAPDLAGGGDVAIPGDGGAAVWDTRRYAFILYDAKTDPKRWPAVGSPAVPLRSLGRSPVVEATLGTDRRSLWYELRPPRDMVARRMT